MIIKSSELMRVGVLALEDCTPLTMIGPMEILRKAGQFCQSMNGLQKPFFDVQIVSSGPKMINTANGYPIFCHANIHDVDKLDLIIIPGLDGDVEKQLQINYSFVPWIKDMYNKGSQVASICTGAFLLAETGLLNGKNTTTHWIAVDLFRQRYPDVDLLPEKIIVDNGNIYSCGGATSYQNLMIYLVEKFCGIEVAHYTAKMLLIDINKNSQSFYSIFSTQKSHTDELILKIQNFIEQNYEADLSLDLLSEYFAISKRTLIRRFKKATSNTPHEYIQRVRVEAAKKKLETSNLTVSQIINKVGYEDPLAFRKIFKKFTGSSPLDYRNKFSFT
jgi:transcriptional regulator GlxA family with amidase domain